MAVKLILLCPLMAVVAQVVVVAQNSINPQTIAGGETGSCPLQEERDAARQNIHSAVLGILQQNSTGSTNFRCGPGQWSRVAFLNMSDPTQQCPSGWREFNNNVVRACGRSTSLIPSCSSSSFSIGSGLQYSRICGQIIGYQVGSTDIFGTGGGNQQQPIDSPYVDGVSVTHGIPRTHIWTNAAGLFHNIVPSYGSYSCPCALVGTSYTPQIPPQFVGNNYYCESGNPTNTFHHSNITYTNDLLWDGEQCEGQCCSNGKSPPWFSVELPNPTTDNIEVRICGTNQSSEEDTPIKLLEIYVQ